MNSKRIYVCHTFYHVYVSLLKEMNLPSSERGLADIVLSTLSNDFGDIKERIDASGVFANTFFYDEKRESFFPELAKYKKSYGNIIFNMFSRIIFTKKFGKLQAKYIPVDFKKYEDIYVYCDADPIGYYLSTHKIYYHAMEDGLDTMSDCVEAIYDNRGCFNLKRFLSEKLNLIFIRDGYNKYCLDMEVNNVSIIRFPFEKYKEVPRQALVDHLTEDDKEILLRVFVKNLDYLNKQVESFNPDDSNILILTEPLLTSLDERRKLFSDLIEEYSKEGNVFLKPHPRDELDYPSVFPNLLQFDKTIPMEIFNFFPTLRFKKVISIYTQAANIHFADEIVRLGHDFMDKYEDPMIHRKDEQI